MSLAGELTRRITPKRSEYEFLLRGSKVFRIQLWSYYGTKMESVHATLLSKVIFFPYIEMGLARRASSGVRIFLAGPRKFCISENWPFSPICRPIKVRPLRSWLACKTSGIHTTTVLRIINNVVKTYLGLVNWRSISSIRPRGYDCITGSTVPVRQRYGARARLHLSLPVFQHFNPCHVVRRGAQIPIFALNCPSCNEFV